MIRSSIKCCSNSETKDTLPNASQVLLRSERKTEAFLVKVRECIMSVNEPHNHECVYVFVCVCQIALRGGSCYSFYGQDVALLWQTVHPSNE